MSATQPGLSVFQYEDHRSFFRDLRTRFPGRKRPLSNRQLAQLLGYSSPRILEMVAKGSRIPSLGMILKVAEKLSLNPEERRYLELLVTRETLARKGKPTQPIEDRILAMRGRVLRVRDVSVEDFRHISEWHYIVVQQLIASPDFREDPEWIARKLKHKITPAQAKEALKRLLDLGLIEKDPKSGRYRYPEYDTMTMTPEVPSKAARSHHRQMLERATEALEETLMPDREFISFTLRIPRERVTEGRKLLREFMQEFNKKMTVEGADEVYQLGLHLFPHTNLKKDTK